MSHWSSPWIHEGRLQTSTIYTIEYWAIWLGKTFTEIRVNRFWHKKGQASGFASVPAHVNTRRNDWLDFPKCHTARFNSCRSQGTSSPTDIAPEPNLLSFRFGNKTVIPSPSTWQSPPKQSSTFEIKQGLPNSPQAESCCLTFSSFWMSERWEGTHLNIINILINI